MSDEPIRDSESMSEETQSFDPAEDDKFVVYGTPCPECGSEEFLEISRQENVVSLEDGGEAVNIVPQPDGLTTEKVICRECDTTLYES